MVKISSKFYSWNLKLTPSYRVFCSKWPLSFFGGEDFLSFLAPSFFLNGQKKACYICRFGKHQIPIQANHLATQFRYYNFCLLLPSLNFGWTNLYVTIYKHRTQSSKEIQQSHHAAQLKLFCKAEFVKEENQCMSPYTEFNT